MAVLQVKNLTKKFNPSADPPNRKADGFLAVDNISFELKEGEILGILGPNGAGKTTTIQMLLGVLSQTSGNVFYFEKDFQENREEILENVNFSSSYTNLVWDLSVKENLSYISYLYAIKNRKERIQEIINIFDLKEIINLEVHKLSAGQLTRTNLAKAFINFPKILLLDEPTASLDPDVARYIRNFLLEERKKYQVSIVITSHNMSEVEEICDRVIFINHGKIIADDKPENLASEIKISHVELFIKDGLKRIREYCEEKKITYKIKARNIVVDLEEKAIPEFLKAIMEAGIIYDEISIEKPTLEDYFLQVTGKSTSSQTK